MSNLYVFVITSWESSEPVILGIFATALLLSLPSSRLFAYVVVTGEGKLY